MKHTVLHTVKWNKVVHYRVSDGGSIQEIGAQVDSAADIWNVPEAMVVLHAGLTNLQKDEVPEEVAPTLKANILPGGREVVATSSLYTGCEKPCKDKQEMWHGVKAGTNVLIECVLNWEQE
ncbi:hypothetical protein MRX96_022350 [Rhipicephalus microplus]